jgi:chromosome partitioning protein
VGPNLGAINRAVLIGADYVILPLAPDLFSMQGLRNLGPALADWRIGWGERRGRCPDRELWLPAGRMEAIGYVVMQAEMRLNRPIRAYERWVQQMPGEVHRQLGHSGTPPASTDVDPACLGVMRHYQSLKPLAQDAKKPMFALRAADGAIGAQMSAVQRCREDFEELARSILARLDAKAREQTT